MERFRVNIPFPGPGGLMVHEHGSEVTREDLAHANMKWLLDSGAIVPAGGVVPASLLPDNPTEEDYRQEIDRLQAELERQGAENDQLKREHENLKLKFPTGDKAIAADNAGRKLADAEGRAARAESRVKELTAELAKTRGTPAPPAPPKSAR